MNTAETIKKDKTIPKKYTGQMLYDFLEQYKLIKGISTEQLCEILGWHNQYYSRLKSVKPNGDAYTITLSTVLKVSKKLCIPPMAILENLYGESITEAEATDFVKKLPAEVKGWLCTPEGRDWILKGYSNFLKDKSDKNIQRRVQMEQQKAEQEMQAYNERKLEKAKQAVLADFDKPVPF